MLRPPQYAMVGVLTDVNFTPRKGYDQFFDSDACFYGRSFDLENSKILDQSCAGSRENSDAREPLIRTVRALAGN